MALSALCTIKVDAHVMDALKLAYKLPVTGSSQQPVVHTLTPEEKAQQMWHRFEGEAGFNKSDAEQFMQVAQSVNYDYVALKVEEGLRKGLFSDNRYMTYAELVQKLAIAPPASAVRPPVPPSAKAKAAHLQQLGLDKRARALAGDLDSDDDDDEVAARPKRPVQKVEPAHTLPVGPQAKIESEEEKVAKKLLKNDVKSVGIKYALNQMGIPEEYHAGIIAEYNALKAQRAADRLAPKPPVSDSADKKDLRPVTPASKPGVNPYAKHSKKSAVADDGDDW